MTFSCLLVVLILMATTQHSIAQSSDQFALSTSQHAALMAVWDKMGARARDLDFCTHSDHWWTRQIVKAKNANDSRPLNRVQFALVPAAKTAS